MAYDGASLVVLVLLLCMQSGSGFAASSSLSSRKDPNAVATIIMDQLRTSSATKRTLDLETDFYDASTGLHSEGVWHNTLAGITCLALGDTQHALQIADSLYRWNWDGTSFRRRAWSGRWDHSKLSSSDNDVVQANYYRESNEHRCVQHAMALVFWSELVCNQLSESMVYNDKYQDQQRLIAARFFDQFRDATSARWSTISQQQGGGTRLRPSASANKATEGGDTEPYFRAVDQAAAVLGCLAHLKILEQRDGDSKKEAKEVQAMIQTTCKDLVTSFGFGEDPKTYLGLNRNRNFWHEGWVLLALLETNYTDAKLSGRIYQQLIEDYGDEADGTVWHWPTASKEKSSNVKYCGDNAMMYAIQKKMQNDEVIGFWHFLAMLQTHDNDGSKLASVADAYPQIRLHPNTELAAFLTWSSSQS